MYITRRSTHTLHFIPLTNSSNRKLERILFLIPRSSARPARVSILSRSKFHKRRNDRILLTAKRFFDPERRIDGVWEMRSGKAFLGNGATLILDHNPKTCTWWSMTIGLEKDISIRLVLSSVSDEIYYYSFFFFFLSYLNFMLWTVASFEYIRIY